MTEITCRSSKTNPFASLVHIDVTMLYSMTLNPAPTSVMLNAFNEGSPRLEVSSTTLETLGENAGGRWPSEVYPVPMSGVCVYI